LSDSDKYKIRKGTRCSSSCVTRDHETFGECLRAKGLQVNPHVNHEYSVRQNAWDAELHAYSDAVRQGVQPAGTSKKKVELAMKASERTGIAYKS